MSSGFPATVVGTVRRRAAPANRPPKPVSPPNTDAPAVRPYRNNPVADDWTAANFSYFRAILPWYHSKTVWERRASPLGLELDRLSQRVGIAFWATVPLL
jgi:hypothetical protein